MSHKKGRPPINYMQLIGVLIQHVERYADIDFEHTLQDDPNLSPEHRKELLFINKKTQQQK